jgi:hypothetical protein
MLWRPHQHSFMKTKTTKPSSLHCLTRWLVLRIHAQPGSLDAMFIWLVTRALWSLSRPVQKALQSTSAAGKQSTSPGCRRKETWRNVCALLNKFSVRLTRSPEQMQTRVPDSSSHPSILYMRQLRQKFKQSQALRISPSPSAGGRLGICSWV